MQQEVKLYNNPKEREMYENMADLYSIIKTTEALERAHMRDAINYEEYRGACAKLITQYKTARKVTQPHVPDVRKFMQDYRLDCEAALDRLESGVPDNPDVTIDPKVVAETVQFFITAMDSLKLNMNAIDQVHPLLTDLFESLNRISALAPNFEGKAKVRHWLSLMASMKASDELNDEQVRQLLFDLETSYTAFHNSLGGGK
ncbi:vacuolar protein sortingassociated protein 28, putative [Acanthamoeba castellanii str. Neff]|uniref:Vacuolar protein sorting-associated protein 28 homolog n=1 Tax=Acanthamoeba castellanii (strain ATCC 30010 / Neff) TaxID=1257118 RepID=L8H286_ACACF|nr:vacuolar protein sortingassociated protein 28, putative [Acanthamoeba castellanii str. Neff]ELR18496.1 vacuolar protein sortingassociated protein 28, putative [Acanthamoeba castellanii str. Neff]